MFSIKCGLLIAAVIVLIVTCTQANRKDAQAPKFIFNLDLPPEKRWDSVLKDFDKDAYVNNIDRLLRTFVDSKILIEIIAELAGNLNRYFPVEFADEIRGISRAIDVDIGYVVLANLVNDLHSYKGSPFRMCTSIVTMTKDGKLIHGRNLDFAFSDFLRNYTIQLDCQRNGSTVYTATTFQTCVGFMTASKPNRFTISFDDRNTGYWWQNLIAALEKSWPELMYIRSVLDNAKSFDEAIHMLKNVRTIASTYFIVGGTKPHEGAIVVGDRNSAKVVWMNSTLEHVWFLVETNYDPWDKPPPEDERREPAIKFMKKWGLNQMDSDHLFNVLSTPPVLNEDTISTIIMSAANSSMYKTIVRFP